MQSHTYKLGTESFKTLSMAYKRFPLKGCCEFLTIGLIYCRIMPTKHVRNACLFFLFKKERALRTGLNVKFYLLVL
jgi:hypothetical protein